MRRLFRRRLPLSVLAAALALLAACQAQPQWQLTNVSGHLPDLRFNLTNDLGQPVTAAAYRGKVAMLYFGYTHCPDVCPLTLAHLHQVLQKLGPAADGVQFLFVTVDPERDTPAVLRRYVAAFDPHIAGLTGTQDQIAALAKRYRAFYKRETPQAPSGSYAVSHSSAIYIFDRDGRARLLETPGDPQAAVVHDLKLLLEQKT
ncbi:MAG TPA: SCO family protein [Gammaproteobacteria bacterium]|nr:SCO family protein [Gammaproteobacteria bacterium]